MIRGNYRSVPHETVIEDAIMLASEGAKEINIIAQDTSAYGMDFNNKTSLPLLLKDIAAVQGPEWLRLLYCYEERITDELIEVMAAEPKIVKYIDIPLQHCSDRILRAMKRRSTHGSIEDTIKKLRSAMPDIAIRTTLMTGFPGETEADFRELEEFVEEMKFDRLGVFAFSPEEGTPAAEFEDQIPQEIAEERRDHIMQLQQEISLEGNRRLVGSTMKVLVCETEEPEDKVYVGRTYKDAPEIDNSVIFRAKTPLTPGDFAEVLITDAMDYDLVGETTT
jgi:ribosomal protein S12 methylthiotransferase